MCKRKTITLRVLAALSVILIVFFIYAWIQYGQRKEQAAALAQNYLERRYEQKMQPDHVIYRILGDPALYVAFFTPENQPDLLFDVIVQDNLTIMDDGLYEFGKSTRPDNYLLQYYKYYAEQEIRPDIEEIWGNSVQFQISIEDNGFYSHSFYPGIWGNMTILEMAPFLKYEYIIVPGQVLDQASREAEGQRIFTFIQMIQESAFQPKDIVFWYQTGEEIQNGLFGKAEKAENLLIIDALDQITSVEQVQRELNNQWFDRDP